MTTEMIQQMSDNELLSKYQEIDKKCKSWKQFQDGSDGMCMSVEGGYLMLDEIRFRNLDIQE